ncbi:MAG: T9SS type A sorting domain-containing protein, partial [Candidatus Cloacimonadaceae bacterium]|nr:T9SS type A sorting domain-containing protein [Candidatus Cloacimonadaceae bacterium]
LNMTYNTTTLSNVDHLMATVLAPVATLPESAISLSNAMQIQYNQLASVEIRTSHLLPSWNVSSYEFNLGYTPDKVEYHGLSVEDTISDGLQPVGTVISPGNLQVVLNGASNLSGSGTLVKVLFRAIGNGASSSATHLIPSNFYYNETQITNLSNGYIVLAPYTSSTDDQVQVPVMSLGAYPNPFNPNTRISYTTENSSPTKIGIYNLKGQLVKDFVDASRASGEHVLHWNGTDNAGRALPSGIYFIKMYHNHKTKTIKVLLLK